MKEAIAFFLLVMGCGIAAAAILDKRRSWRGLIGTGLLLGLIAAAAHALAGCGGDPFTVGLFVDGGVAGDVEAAHPVMNSSPSEDDAADVSNRLEPDPADGGRQLDAGAAAEREASSPPTAADAGVEAEPDSAGNPPPPPPALCCETPCSGSAVAPIACGNGPAWTCAAGSCADRACELGAACAWMGTTCTGRVAVCP